jgi:predicted XRE-type DNA-binding protein
MPQPSPKQYLSVWEALEADAGEARNLQLRAELMRAISGKVAREAWTQSAAAAHCGLTQPRMNDLLRGRLSRFSLDALVNVAVALGLRVGLTVSAA